MIGVLAGRRARDRGRVAVLWLWVLLGVYMVLNYVWGLGVYVSYASLRVGYVCTCTNVPVSWGC